MQMKTSPNDVSNQEILQELHRLNDKIDGVSTSLNSKIDGLNSSLNEKIDTVHIETMEAIHGLAEQTETRLISLEREQTRLRANMVTKSYLDDKMADWHSDVIRHAKKEIAKAMG